MGRRGRGRSETSRKKSTLTANVLGRSDDGRNQPTRLDNQDAAPNACVQAGGECGCSCRQSYHLAPSLSSSCPPPCPTCGACSGNCCLPDALDSGNAADSPGGGLTDAGPTPCGTATCGAGQICVQPCSGTAPQPPPHCAPRPAGCAGILTCGCLPSDICGGAGMCTDSFSIHGSNVVCFGCA
jgi:hypothetical protein